jgi:predicted protein tyrosine phosphatase
MNSKDLTLCYEHVPYMNRYQGNWKKVLCVCSAGLLRSPTAAEVLREEFDYNTRAAGAEPQFALIPVSAALIMWADEIVCMTKTHYKTMLVNFKESVPDGTIEKKAKVLNIPDDFGFRSYMCKEGELQKLILERYRELTPAP